MSQSLLGSLISLSYCCSCFSLIVFRYRLAKRLQRRESSKSCCFTSSILTSLSLNHNCLHYLAMIVEKNTQTWAKCSSPACPSSGSHTADAASWSQRARRSFPPMVAEKSQSGLPLCPLVNLLGTHEQTPSRWLLVSELSDTSPTPAYKKAFISIIKHEGEKPVIAVMLLLQLKSAHQYKPVRYEITMKGWPNKFALYRRSA